MSKKFIKAGAGSGKTYKIMQEIVGNLQDPTLNIHIQDCIVTTFTEKAAQELKERIAQKLLSENMYNELSNLPDAKIGTVHSICADFLKQYGYLINLSPNLDVITQEERNLVLEELIHEVIDSNEFTEICERLEKIDNQTKQATFPADIISIIDLAKANKISSTNLVTSSLDKSKDEFINRQGRSLIIDWQDVESILKQVVANIDHLKTYQYAKDLETDVNIFLTESVSDQGEIKIRWASLQRIVVNIERAKVLSVYESLQKNVDVRTFNQWKLFQDDLIAYKELVFHAAAKVMQSYEDRKRAMGLMDFNDMESYMLDLLGNEDFQKEFSNAIKFVLVDEFQDTNPVQAEIFTKWHQFASKSFWVGDNKQSIYRFRGADLNFIRSITENVESDTLNTSYRSRTKIVELSNQLFQPIFEVNDYPEAMQVNRVEEENQYANALHMIEGNDASNIAKTVKNILHHAGEWPVNIKNTDETRTIESKDIAILVHANKEVNEIVAELIKRHIPVAQFGKYLVQEDEIIFFNSILSFIANPLDQFAISKIAYYQHFNLDAKKWIDHRVAFMNARNQAMDENIYLENNEEQAIFQANYGSDIEFIKRLGAFQKVAKVMSITELIDQLILDFSIDNIVANWGRGEIRRHNLNTYRGIAVEYQQYCLHFGKIQSIFGFIGYLEKITKTKEFSEIENPIGVKVLTYHRSKGLEYPMVIAAGMDNKLRTKNIYKAIVKNEGENQQLAGRWIQFFVDPLSSQTNSSCYYSAMNEIEESERSEEIAEKKRLLYVGLTRPRDYLIFPFEVTKGELKSKWLENCIGEGWHEQLKSLGIQTIDSTEEGQITQEENFFLPSSKAEQIENPISFLINPSKNKDALGLGVKDAHQIGEITPKLRALQTHEFSVFGDMIHQVMACSHFPATFENLIDQYGFSDVVDVNHLKTIVQNFNQWIESNWQNSNPWYEIPFRLSNQENQLLNGIIDLALETKDGWILIDHKTYDGTAFKDKIEQEGYLSQLAYYQKALTELSDKPVLKTYLHFPMTGNVVEIA